MKESVRCSSGRPGPKPRWRLPADCVTTLRRLRYARERAAIQEEIDRLQERRQAAVNDDERMLGDALGDEEGC